MVSRELPCSQRKKKGACNFCVTKKSTRKRKFNRSKQREQRDLESIGTGSELAGSVMSCWFPPVSSFVIFVTFCEKNFCFWDQGAGRALQGKPGHLFIGLRAGALIRAQQAEVGGVL